MRFQKLKRVWSHNDMNHIPGFREAFPELAALSSEDLCDRFSDLGINLYTQETASATGWIRLTLPIAVVVWLLMLIGLPFAFLATGRWHYRISETCLLLNWFRAVFP